jgi:hypothetical protein
LACSGVFLKASSMCRSLESRDNGLEGRTRGDEW